MITAPTSAIVAPSAAITAAITPIFASRSANKPSWMRPAPSARAWSSSPGGRPWIAAGVRATMYGSASTACAMYTAVSVNSIRSEPSAPCGSTSSSTAIPTTTDGSARLALASSWSVRRPRKRPSPRASPIGRPITRARRGRHHRDPERDPEQAHDVRVAVGDQRDRAAELVPEVAHSGSRPGRSVLDVHELSVGEPIDDPGLGAVADRARARLRQRRHRLSRFDVDVLSAFARRPRLVIAAPRWSEDSAASRNATDSTIPRSNRLTSPSSGSPARSSRLREWGVTEIMLRLLWIVDR